MTGPITSTPLSRWELAAEMIAVKIRWFGLLFGYLLVNVSGGAGEHPIILNAILGLGAGYALVDTAFSLRGAVFLGRWPLLISSMEALFIGLLCYYHQGLESAFRYYYFLSLICCAIRYSARLTYLTFALHGASYGILYLVQSPERQLTSVFLLTLVFMGWVTWASAALALLLKSVGDHLGRLNAALQENQTLLEERIAERTRELHESQAHVLHQEKMAAFGLLAAGIAHEVGNPLASISSLVQMLQRRETEPYTQERLGLINGQLQRIQTTLRELVNFSRPASSATTRVSMAEVIEEALNIAKYHKRIKGRFIENRVPRDLPPVIAVRDQLVQVLLNLILNAMDATGRGGNITLDGKTTPAGLEIQVRDDGVGIAADQAERLFQPYFTTKKDGTGLGLFVTRKLVMDHGGSLDFVSTPEGGTVFYVRLPLHEDGELKTADTERLAATR